MQKKFIINPNGLVLSTDGSGLWSNKKTSLSIELLELDIFVEDDNDCEYGSLEVYFDSVVWDVAKDGLIYTDKMFIEGLKTYMVSIGVDPTSLSYSEQGMQGFDYVHFDIDVTSELMLSLQQFEVNEVI